MNLRRAMPPARAFTLIELLLAVAIFAMVLAAVNTVFYGALRLRNSSSRAVDAAQPVLQTVSVIRHDLLNTIPPSGGLAGDFKLGSFSSSFSMATVNGLQCFTTTGPVGDDAPWGDIQMVTYQLRAAAGSGSAGKDLIRSVTRNLLPSATQEVDDQWLMGNITSLEFDGYDGSAWQSSWDTSQGNTNLPVAVRVRIQLASNAGPGAQPLEIIVPLNTQSRTNQTQTTPATGGTGG
jgi:type II secretion system protein J